MRKNILIFVFLFFLLYAEAQISPTFYPFKGFHVGITGQAQYMQKCSFVAISGTDPAPKPKMTYGWEAGIEFSYHFAKYFGITAGIKVGTVFSYTFDPYLSDVPDFFGGMITINEYDDFAIHRTMRKNEILFPLKIEFHYPLRKDLFFMAEAGVRLRGIFERLYFGKEAIGVFEHAITYSLDPSIAQGDTLLTVDYYESSVEWNMSKIRCDLLVGLGLYYKLPYGDLLRFTAGVNLSFNPIGGYYRYFLTDSYGSISIHSSFIYTQLSYVHTLNYQKAKKYVKKQDYSFNTKRERREKIYELLKDY